MLYKRAANTDSNWAAIMQFKSFYDAASENLNHAAFLHLVKNAQQNAGV